MNEQKAPGGIEWTRVWDRRGYTWNPVSGCKHACVWKMPNGEQAQCYAKTVAEGIASSQYPQGFEGHYWHPERLSEPQKLKEPAGIFLDSMSDLMGHWVEDAQISAVLDACRAADRHVFFLLTKNAPRLRQFDFPANVWVGVSSPPDLMWGKPIDRKKQTAMLRTSLKMLSEVKATVRWMSFEPLSWDVSSIVTEFPDALQWAVIGAASNGRAEYPPEEQHLRALLTVLDARSVPVFYKGNLRSLPYARANWRDHFPRPAEPASEQISVAPVEVITKAANGEQAILTALRGGDIVSIDDAWRVQQALTSAVRRADGMIRLCERKSGGDVLKAQGVDIPAYKANAQQQMHEAIRAVSAWSMDVAMAIRDSGVDAEASLAREYDYGRCLRDHRPGDHFHYSTVLLPFVRTLPGLAVKNRVEIIRENIQPRVVKPYTAYDAPLPDYEWPME